MMSDYVWVGCLSQRDLKKEKAKLRLWLLEALRENYAEQALVQAKKVLPFLLKAKTLDDLATRKCVVSYCRKSELDKYLLNVEAAYAWVTASTSSNARKSK